MFCARITTERLTDSFVEALCTALVEANLDYLRRHPETPPLYRSGVRYAPEHAQGSRCENWFHIGRALKARRVDCEDLACWRAAELRHRGEPARTAHSKRRIIKNGKRMTVWHIVVVRAGGWVEDPSRRLGMKGLT